LIKVLLFSGIKLTPFIVTLLFTLNINKALLFKIRHFEVWIFILLILVSLLSIIASARKHKCIKNVETIVFIILLTCNCIFFLQNHFQYLNYKKVVFNTDPVQIRRLGKHFIMGYSNETFHEIKKLVETGGLGGVYLTRRNFEGKTFFDIKKEIALLQSIQKKNGYPPLLVAADHEGGIVSRVSPPLTRLPGLANLVNTSTDKTSLQKKIEGYATIQSVELSEIGINVNLSPVVDLKTSVQHNVNVHTRIDLRSISGDVTTITDVAMIYSLVLEENGVIPTLKHFPGLGRVTQDTHLFTGTLDKKSEDLSETDWLPFKKISKKTGAFIMLGHVLLTDADNTDLVSYSKKIITGVIRNKWQHNGVLITDDLNMGPIANSEEGIGGISVKALNAGVDLLLLSYDGEQYYKAVYELIDAENQGRLDRDFLAESSRRLDRAISVMQRRKGQMNQKRTVFNN